MKQHLLLGTAGHIDHGKTALVKALTGIDTDRLPDEKRRKITIDLGFAPLELDDYHVGIVDVPGHERFVKNMLAGATGVDLALLVVAADDSVKPQTREHLDILEYLQLDAGVIAITKCDLAEPGWIDLVEGEIRELIAGTRLESAPIVRVSARSGEGIQQLRHAISSAADLVMSRRVTIADAPFRMSIDRVFTMRGHGTVVTGSIASGRICVGDQLELQPQDIRVRVRGLQSHSTALNTIGRGQRAAVNLRGTHYDQITRGQILVSPGTLQSSRILTVSIILSQQASRPIKHRERVRLHIGTSELQGFLSLLESPILTPGSETFAQIFLAKEVAVAWGQPFVIRSNSPVETLGGGRILDGTAERIKRLSNSLHSYLTDLASDDPMRRASASSYFAGTKAWQPSDLSISAGVEKYTSVVDQLLNEKSLYQFVFDNGRTQMLHHELVYAHCERIEEILALEHKKTPLRSFVERSRLTKYFKNTPPELLDAILSMQQDKGSLLIRPRGIALSNWSPALSEQQRLLLERVVDLCRQGGFQPPTLNQLLGLLGEKTEGVACLLEVATENGTLVRISGGVYLHCEAVQEAKSLLSDNMASGQSLSVSQIRELLETSRKIAVPFCEYLDGVGFTRRDGDHRTLVNNKPSEMKQ